MVKKAMQKLPGDRDRHPKPCLRKMTPRKAALRQSNCPHSRGGELRGLEEEVQAEISPGRTSGLGTFMDTDWEQTRAPCHPSPSFWQESEGFKGS